jgi:WhiB family redox-sensing transcriptional regulator
VTITDISWRQKGACQGLDPAVFFPDEGDEETAAVAIAVCDTCDVRIACLEHALASREKEGVWVARPNANAAASFASAVAAPDAAKFRGESSPSDARMSP